jgi:Zn-dependent M28 family amino/carboxypeptidase
LSTPHVDLERLRAHVRTLSETFHPRDWQHPENLDRAAAFIGEEFRRARGRVSEQPLQAQGRNYRNVLALFGPAAGERVVVGAHYDTAGPQPGADDNASAVAGLIELAHFLGRANLSLPVEVVAYCLEEPPFFGTPLMGSMVHARNLRTRKTGVRVMICLEMIGYFRDEPGSQDYPLPLLRLFYPSRGNFIAVVGKFGQRGVVQRIKRAMLAATPLRVCSLNAPALVPGIDLSDHRSYWSAGYKAVMITDTAFYRNPHYHAQTDTWDTLDYERLAMVVEGVCAAVLDHARAS